MYDYDVSDFKATIEICECDLLMTSLRLLVMPLFMHLHRHESWGRGLDIAAGDS